MLLRSISSARGAILSAAEPRTLSRRMSAVSPRPKSKPRMSFTRICAGLELGCAAATLRGSAKPELMHVRARGCNIASWSAFRPDSSARRQSRSPPSPRHRPTPRAVDPIAVQKRESSFQRTASGCIVLMHGELTYRAPGSIRGRPHSSAVRFGDRTTDRQSHAHASRLGRVKRIEQVIEALRFQSRARIAYGDEHAVRRVQTRVDQQLARSLADLAHRFDGVHDQVQDHLLQLDSISPDARQTVRELGLQQDAMPPHLAPCQGDRFEDRFVDVQAGLPRRELLDEGANAADDFAGLIACLDDMIECIPDLLEVRWLSRKPA